MAELDRVKREMVAAAAAYTRTFAESVLGAAQRDAPVEEGTLRGSGYTEIKTHGFDVVAEIGFATPYAARQHEELDWEHPLGGKAKYLEDQLKQAAARYPVGLAAAVRKAVG